MNFDKLQIDIIKDSTNLNTDMWRYYCGDEGKIFVAPMSAATLFRMPQEECKLVLERVADRYETLQIYYKRITEAEDMETYKELRILGTVKPYLQYDVMYKLIDKDGDFYVYIFPKWLKYVDLENVEILGKDSKSPVIIKEKGEIVQLVAPIRIDGDWGV
ncbi:hypothetical protein [Anaerovibrio sp. RM50]|uniref:hypothetical protein n=1 Tax=Anaerovibrio sp. RM50 TaxID=1200557 RepID=UPI000488194E|nr:hypothetical protein [Anaerovibrio sp. RM50]